MTMQETYQQLGGNYEEMLCRLRMPSLVERFALKFLSDTSFKDMTDAMAEGNVEAAFRAAHTLKGVCANLSFTRLQSSSSEITEALRAQDMAAAGTLYPRVEEDYRLVIDTLEAFRSSKES